MLTGVAARLPFWDGLSDDNDRFGLASLPSRVACRTVRCVRSGVIGRQRVKKGEEKVEGGGEEERRRR